MKIIKKSGIVLAVLLVILLCSTFSACKYKKSAVGTWDFYSCILLSWSFYLGIPFHYAYDEATIEVGNYSDDGIIVFDKSAEVIEADSFSDYSHYAGHKQVTHSEAPFKFSGDSSTTFWWVTVTDWWDWENRGENKADDYIYFIARKNDKIVGYAVIYVWSDGEEGSGKVLKDKRHLNISEEKVNTKINKVIETHKNSVA